MALTLLGRQLSDLVLYILSYAVDCGPMLKASSLYGPSTQHPTPCTVHCSLVTPHISAVLAKQPSTPTRQGHSPMARVQAARSFFTSSRGAGCKAGHPQAVLEGLVQALHQLPTDLSQGQHACPCWPSTLVTADQTHSDGHLQLMTLSLWRQRPPCQGIWWSPLRMTKSDGHTGDMYPWQMHVGHS